MNQNSYKNNSNDEVVDAPLKEDPKYEQVNVESMNKYEASMLENRATYADRMDKHVYKKHGLNLLWASGIAYIIIVILDTVFTNALGWQTSELTQGLIELLKFLVSTLMGYVFCETSKKYR